MMLLFDSTRGNDLRVGIANSALRVLRRTYDHSASSELLGLVDELLKKNRISLKHVQGIVVASGPGPFSALRVSAALANALSFALGIPAVGVRSELTMKQLAEQGREKLHRAKLGVPVIPFYGKLPNITRPNRRSYKP